MTDVDDIIDYIKSLKKGFDKDLFLNKIDELAYVVETTGLVYDDFHTLFKVWLNLSIPITKWVNLGSCLVPLDKVQERTVEYALRWILANYENQSSFPRVCFLLDWLTAAMECESIDMTVLDYGYEIFYNMLAYEVLTVHVVKLVYTLTKPVDVSRRRVLELINYAKKREGKKNMVRQLQVLLGLFKSYKPECVPEDVPAISIHTAFKKLNIGLLSRFRMSQERRNRHSRERQHLMWINPLNSDRGRNKKSEPPLVPNVEFHYSSRHSVDKEPLKNFLDFSDPVSLVHYSLQYMMTRPMRLRALLCNETGQILLSISSHSQQAFLAHDLHHLLNNCFLELSPYTYREKQDLLQRLAVFQRTLVQGVPVVTRFLAQYLPLWNEKDFFPEILELVEWVSVNSPEHVQDIADALSRIYFRAQPMEQCAILRALTNMYTNLVYSSTKTRQHFLNTLPSLAHYSLILPDLAERISIMCHKGLQIDPDDTRVLYSSIWSAQRRTLSERTHGASIGALPTPITFALPLLGLSAVLLDHIAKLIILYQQNVMSSSKTKSEAHIEFLNKYMNDILNCLYSNEALSDRQNGFIFERLHPQLVSKLGCLMSDVDAKLSIRNHLAFAPYTYTQSVAIDHKDVDNKMLFNSVVYQEFPNLGRFLKKALPELRYQ